MATDTRQVDKNYLDNMYPLTPPPPVSDPYADCQKWGSIVAIAICSIAALGAILLIVAHNGYNVGPFSDLATVIEHRWACLTLALASTGLALGLYGLLSLHFPPEEPKKQKEPKKPITPPTVPTPGPKPTPIPVTHTPPPVTATPTTPPSVTPPKDDVKEMLERSNLDPEDYESLKDLLD